MIWKEEDMTLKSLYQKMSKSKVHILISKLFNYQKEQESYYDSFIERKKRK